MFRKMRAVPSRVDPFRPHRFPPVLTERTKVTRTSVSIYATHDDSHFSRPLAVGDTVELQPEDSRSKGDFLRIFSVSEQNGETTLLGLRFRRSKYFPVPHRFNKEVILVVKDDVDAAQLNVKTPPKSALDAVPLHRVLCRRNLKTSSDPYPMHYNSCPNAPLICRRVSAGTLKDGCLLSIRPEEADIATKVHESVSLTQRLKSKLLLGNLTYGSGFCGAGGDLLGARYAGLKPVFAFDNNPDACSTSRANNHPSCNILCKDQGEILDLSSSTAFGVPCPEYLVIYHCSFPCQYFSPANTRKNPLGDARAYLSLAVAHHLERFKPMVFTSEQTFGLATHEPEWMHTFISEIARMRYNIRWKIHSFHDYGLPSLRKRLIVIASREGLPLPPFPAPTHGPGRSFPYQHVHDYISDIPSNASYHLDMAYRLPEAQRPYDPKTRRINCVMTSGVDAAHPSGLRTFTPREIANLQTFPTSYKLIGNKTSVIKQAGNCAPPLVMKTFFKSIIKTLEDWAHGRIDSAGRPTVVAGSSFANAISLEPSVEPDFSSLASELPGSAGCPVEIDMTEDETFEEVYQGLFSDNGFFESGSALNPVDLHDDEDREPNELSRSARSSCTLQDEMEIDEAPELNLGSVLRPIIVD